MGDEKDDLPYFATCTHCGMQTGLSLKQVEDDKPLKCPACGAPLEIAPPPKAPRKAKKPKRDYGQLIDDPVWGAYWRDRRAGNGGSGPEMTALYLIFWAAVFLVFIFILLLGKC